MDSLDASEAEVIALLVGCHKLPRMEGFNAVIEHDSVSAVQRSSGKFSHPWRLVDLVCAAY